MPDLDFYSYLYSAEVVRLAVIMGLIVGVLIYERFHLTSGGAIVPGFLALSMTQPEVILATVAAATGAWLVVHRLLPRVTILYGRRLFEVELLSGVAFVIVAAALGAVAGKGLPFLVGFSTVGMLIPGIIAHDMGRQGPAKTLGALAVATGIVALGVLVIDSVLRLLRLPSQPLALESADRGGYPEQLILPAVIVSILIGMLLFSTLGLRSGGFVTAAYLAYVAPVWQDLVFTAACAVATYLLVIAITQPLLLFGRRKLASMIMVGAVVTWSAEYAVTALTQGTYVPWSGLTVMTLMVPALLANDAQRQGWPRTIIAAVLGTVGVFAAMRLLAAGAGWLGLL
ncbi:MAG: poly-gamma-glutamate biosynthesis protein PgsC/CapC [Propionibacteriaceae bacterium]|nr:hypothetical protein [Propionibacteriaceae bacterium]HBY22142.1 hypothetical protein [Propionibacteriaceae bacterium]